MIRFSMLWNSLVAVYVAQSLDFNSTQTGILMAFGAASLSIFTFFIQPFFLRTFAYKPQSIVFSVALWFVVLLMPTVSLLKGTRWDSLYVLMVCTCLLHGAKYACAAILFVTTLCFLNNSVPPNQCGRVNGIAQAFSALMRGFGPLSGGAIWSWSMSLDGWMTRFRAYPAYLFTFLFLVLTTLVLWRLIDDDMQIPWEDKQVRRLGQKETAREEDDFEKP